MLLIMNKSDKNRKKQAATPTIKSADQRRRTKLKPQTKQKYKPKQVYYSSEDENEELDLFGYLDRE